MRMLSVPLSSLILLAGIFTPARSMQGKDATNENQPQDRIEVIGHFPLANSPVERLLPTQHYRRYYLYAEQADGKVTVMDITDAKAPSVVENVTYPADQKSDTLLALTGTVALVGSATPAQSAEAPQTVRIMNLADASHPKVAREFVGVTAMGHDSQRGLVFLANGDGVWILREHFAEDPAVESSYSAHVLYDH